MQQLESILSRIEGKSYPLYKQIKGIFNFNNFKLEILHVQGDPFAQPSHIAIHIDNKFLSIDENIKKNRSRRTGYEDGMLRSFSKVLNSFSKQRGSGKSGLWQLIPLGQEIISRSACEISETQTSLRIRVGLPANGRRILAHEAINMLCQVLPTAVNNGLINADKSIWIKHSEYSEDQDFIREYLKINSKIAFIGNQSILPRKSGICDLPLEKAATTWDSPKELLTELELPNFGKIKGSLFPEGISLICGGGFHGKSTLLNAISNGVYNHIPGDGREFCITHWDSVSIRSEDRRSITGVNISPFINNLPNNKNIFSFSTPNASGSTSQAANIIEAVELGAKCLLIDEDTSATNFMVRDRRMQELISKEKEPITPFIDRVEEIYKNFGISTIIVVGGSGDYFQAANLVLVIDSYKPFIKTQRAKEIANSYPANRKNENTAPLEFSFSRTPMSSSFDPSLGNKNEKVRINKTRFIEYGREEIDVSFVSQLVDRGQSNTIADLLIRCFKESSLQKLTIKELCIKLETDSLNSPLSKLVKNQEGDRVFVRRYELGSAINRLRSLKLQ